MNGKTILLTALVALAFAMPVSAGSLGDTDAVLTPWRLLHCNSPEVEAAEDAGLDPYTHTYVDPASPHMTVTVHLLCLEQETSELGVLTDCTATSYSHTGWWLGVTYSGQIDTWNPSGISSANVLNAFSQGAEVWDAAVNSNLFGSFSSGGSRWNVGSFDGVNQHGWLNLDSGTIAVTYTWASGGTVSESDAAYNTDFSWSTSGSGSAMDLQNIAAHELGHTFGMGHSSSSGVNACLTMYPSGALGETQKRTLGDGDILGIQALYW